MTAPHWLSTDNLLDALQRPDRLVQSAWLEHIPFGMYVVARTKPRLLVELGTHYGASYCAFCESVRVNQLDTRCFAIDTWEGDDHTGFYGNQVYESLHTYNEERFGQFSTLKRSTFQDSLPYFADNSIDLLHIDGYHTYEETRNNFDNWLPKMSNRGIVLLHDTNVRRNAFGVWQVWQELTDEYPHHFEFHHEHGLGILAVGDSIPDAIQPLFGMTSDEQQAVRQLFAYCGQRWRNKYRHKITMQRANQAEKEQDTLRDQHQAELDKLQQVHQTDLQQRLQTQRDQHQAELDKLQQVHQTDLQQRLQTQRDQHQAELDKQQQAHQAELDTLQEIHQTTLETLQAKLANRQYTLTTLRQQQKNERDNRAQLQIRYETDIQALQTELRKQSHTLTTLQQTHQATCDTLRSRLAVKQFKIERLHQRYDQVQTTAKTQIAALQAELKTLRQHRQQQQTIIQTLWMQHANEKKTLQTTIATLKNTLQTRQQQIEQQQSDLQTAHTQHADTLTDYQQKLASQAADLHNLRQQLHQQHQQHQQQQNPAATSSVSPPSSQSLTHFITRFIPEWLKKRWRIRRDMALLQQSDFFDDTWYLNTYPDVATAGINPVEHYVRYGAGEGRDPSPVFSTNWYLQQYPDVAAARVNPLAHYLRYGASEKRRYAPVSRAVSAEGSVLPSPADRPITTETPSTPPGSRTVRHVLHKRFPMTQPLQVFPVSGNQRRLNLVTDSINSGSLFGGVATALIFATLLANRWDSSLRIITRRQAAEKKNFARILKVNGLQLHNTSEFVFADVHNPQRELPIQETDVFLTTSWWTTWSIRQTLSGQHILYLLQEDERNFYPYDDDRVRCTDILNDVNMTFIINSRLLYDSFLSDGFQHLRQRGHWFEPAWPAGLFFHEPTTTGKKKFFFYARPHHLRNLYYLGLEVLHTALARRILNLDDWEIHFVGIDTIDFSLPFNYRPHTHSNLVWDDYAALVRQMDAGLALMYSPHPSYPPVDLAASGAAVVTNRYGNKQDLNRYSENILCCDLTVEALVEGVRRSVALANDRDTRLRNYENSPLLRDWHHSFADVLDALATYRPGD